MQQARTLNWGPFSRVRPDKPINNFSNLKKAYDTTWKYRFMKDLYDVDLRGRLPLFIQNFYLEGNFESVWEHPSDFNDQEIRVPQ